MGYVANTRIKVGTSKTEDGELYIEVGEEVDEDAFDEDEWAALEEAGAVVTEEEFEELNPEAEEGGNQPSGTPSNMEQIEGTDLEAKAPEAVEEPAPKAAKKTADK
jgi:hypothetical protein